jgi:hypothetical protein
MAGKSVRHGLLTLLSSDRVSSQRNISRARSLPCMWMKITVLSIALVALTDMALAQAPPKQATPPAGTTSTPAPNSANCSPDPAAPNGTTTGERKEPLGDKLAKSDGVLCPPAGVDPEIRAQTPKGGNTPVIPPPGSPGGDPTVRPK